MGPVPAADGSFLEKEEGGYVGKLIRGFLGKYVDLICAASYNCPHIPKRRGSWLAAAVILENM